MKSVFWVFPTDQLPPQQAPSTTAEAPNQQLNQTWAHARCIRHRSARIVKNASIALKTRHTPKTGAFCETANVTGVSIPGGPCRHLSRTLIRLLSALSSRQLSKNTSTILQSLNHAHHCNHPLPDHTADRPAALHHGNTAAARQAHEGFRLHLPCHCTTPGRLSDHS